ncbi:Tfp pilus assembly protein PilF [Limimonas halophila]|uniref:Tfp pilus assembly protein PilF n=1 Tax=Limimonas halophila TaxID=1082479 RepID=A0A1G7L938_9PROT|nr:tetratricopeptide repeat protein [Limimonas halophila]SDF45881.1 Tfp pilus assembly protein PilF [Limimonas halophila]
MRCRNSLGPIALAAVLAGGHVAAPAHADQTDPRLDSLFAELDDAESYAEGQRIAEKIWSIWYEHEDPQVREIMARGQRAMESRQLAAALAAFDQAVRLDPDYAEAWNKRATIHFMLGNYEKSLADIERVLALAPRHFGALSGRGLCHMKLGNPRKALDAMEKSLAIHPQQPGTRARAEQLRDRLGERDI